MFPHLNFLLLRQFDRVPDACPVTLYFKEARGNLFEGIHAGILAWKSPRINVIDQESDLRMVLHHVRRPMDGQRFVMPGSRTRFQRDLRAYCWLCCWYKPAIRTTTRRTPPEEGGGLEFPTFPEVAVFFFARCLGSGLGACRDNLPEPVPVVTT
jgi:hypothetical protein